MRKNLVLVPAVFMALAGCAAAADISRLNWNEFIVGDISQAEGTKTELNSEHGKLSATLTIAGLAAHADGDKTSASASYSGEFLLTQPKGSDLGLFHATISGLIVKTQGATARIDVSFGTIKQSFAWSEGEIKSERFNLDIQASVPGGRLPTPLPVSAIMMVTKPSGSGAVLLSLDSITVEAGPALVGSVQETQTPVLQGAKPARIAAN